MRNDHATPPPLRRQFPEQLEHVERLKLRTLTKKSVVDTRLKTALHQQRDDVKRGLGLIKEGLTAMEGVRTK